MKRKNNSILMDKKILLGLTTTPGSDWRGKIKEIDQLGIKEISLFPTCLDFSQRRQMYGLLEKTNLEAIPHVHLREEDFEDGELAYLTERYKTEVFNLHPNSTAFGFIQKHPDLRKKIFVENLFNNYSKGNLNLDNFKKYGVAGICLDFSHMATEKEICREYYQRVLEILKIYPVGCNHISGFKSNFLKRILKLGAKMSSHWCFDESWLDYLKEFPASYFSPYLSIELENPFAEQLEFKKYLEQILKPMLSN